jgi:hypothetical protein
MRGIESCFDHDAPSVGQFHPQPAACRHGINQFNRQQLCGWSYSAGAYPLAIIVQRVNRHTTRFAECFPPQPALFKIPHQTFRFRLAPTTSTNNRSRITHASTSTRHQLREKSGFARMHTVNVNDSWIHSVIKGRSFSWHPTTPEQRSYAIKTAAFAIYFCSTNLLIEWHREKSRLGF